MKYGNNDCKTEDMNRSQITSSIKAALALTLSLFMFACAQNGRQGTPGTPGPAEPRPGPHVCGTGGSDRR